MPGPTIADAAVWTAISAPPADGDDVKVSGGTAPFRANVLQPYADRDRFLLEALQGHWAGEPEVYHRNGMTELRVRGFRGLVIGSRILSQPLFDVGVALSGLTPGDWYYLYAYDSGGGVLAFEVSATAPDAPLVWKSGGTTHRYLCSMRAWATDSVVPFRKTGRLTRYMRDMAGAYTRALTLGNAGTWTAIPLQYLGVDLLPMHASVAELALLVGGGGGTVQIRRAAASSGAIGFGQGTFRETVYVYSGPGHTIDYIAGSPAELTLDVTGWEE